MNHLSALLALCALLALPGCHVYHREMLGKAIADFSSPMRDSNPEKIWVSNMQDSGCDAHAAICGGCGGAASAGGGGGLLGIFSGGTVAPAAGPSPHDGLAREVFSNFLTQKRKGRVVEGHRHNYATDLGVDTHIRVETTTEAAGSTRKASQVSCEDLCLLDEAKKRKADKVLAYAILEMLDDELKIHLRLSDVRTGLVEFSRTLHVVRGTVTDISF